MLHSLLWLWVELTAVTRPLLLLLLQPPLAFSAAATAVPPTVVAIRGLHDLGAVRPAAKSARSCMPWLLLLPLLLLLLQF
jgi:hypothetical protein